jgi:hypothetical protein
MTPERGLERSGSNSGSRKPHMRAGPRGANYRSLVRIERVKGPLRQAVGNPCDRGMIIAVEMNEGFGSGHTELWHRGHE